MTARHYCSTCLQPLEGGETRCTRPTCEKAQPSTGWPRIRSPGDDVGGRYTIQALLGMGGAGVTYRALDRGQGAGGGLVVALKVLHEDRAMGVLRERLRLEGEVLLRLRHPHIVEFRDLKVDGEPPFWLATSLVSPVTLDRMVRTRGMLTPREALDLGRQLAAGLAHAHALGVVHRDLKPPNVLVEESPRLHAWIVDFGVARARQGAAFAPREPLTVLGGFVGTPEYAAPEQLLGEPDVGPPADLFALGVLLHVAAGGEPVRATLGRGRLGKEALRAHAAQVQRRRLDLDGAPDRALTVLDDTVDLLLRPNPADRPTAAAVADRFRRALEALDQPLPDPPRPRGEPEVPTAQSILALPQGRTPRADVPRTPYTAAPAWEPLAAGARPAPRPEPTAAPPLGDHGRRPEPWTPIASPSSGLVRGPHRR